MKIDVLRLKKSILEEELIFKRNENELKIKILNAELASKLNKTE